MRIGRSLPPAAAPIYLMDLVNGFRGLCRGDKELERFTDELREQFRVRHCFMVSSGTAALTLILKALKELNPGRHEVAIPAYTCYSVPAAVLRAGLSLRLCDMDIKTLGFASDGLATLVKKSKPLCLVPTHLYGVPCPLEPVQSLAWLDGTLLVEDAAQAMGAAVDGQMLGCRGDVGFYSLGRGKALSTVDGGIIVTNRDDIARQLRKQAAGKGSSMAGTVGLAMKALALHFLQRPSFFWLPRAIPLLGLGKTVYDPAFPLYGFSPFQAGLGRTWRAKLQAFRRARRALIDRWQELAQGSRHFKTLLVAYESMDVIRFPLCVEDTGLRDRILLEADRAGLGIMPGYPTAVNGIAAIAERFAGERYPVAEQLARELVTLPVHPLVSPGDVARIEQFLKRW